MHFHRDLIVADGYAREVLNVTEDDVASARRPPTSGSGTSGFPLRFGATATLLENAAPPEMVKNHRNLQGDDLLCRDVADGVSRDDGRDGQGRRSVVAGGLRSPPAEPRGRWCSRTGLRGPARPFSTALASTELLHIFINCVGDAVAGTNIRSGATRQKIVDMNELPPETVGKLQPDAAISPTAGSRTTAPTAGT